MATLTVRDVDEAVLERLKAAAQAHNRSLAGEVREALAVYVAGNDLDTARAQRAAWLEGLDAIAARSRLGKPGDSLQDILDEIRAERR